MSLNRNNLLIIPFEHSGAFSSLGDKLAQRLGASELLYAAVAYYSWENELFAQSLIDNNPELTEEIMWWLEDILTSYYSLFNHIRTFHNGQDLDQVVYDAPEETLYVSSKARPVFCGHRRLSTIRTMLRSHAGPDDSQPW